MAGLLFFGPRKGNGVERDGCRGRERPGLGQGHDWIWIVTRRQHGLASYYVLLWGLIRGMMVFDRWQDVGRWVDGGGHVSDGGAAGLHMYIPAGNSSILIRADACVSALSRRLWPVQRYK